MRAKRKSPPNLNRIYAAYNHTYFRNRLPKVDLRYTNRRFLGGSLAITLQFPGAFIAIRIWRGLADIPTFLRLVILHEMCHVKLLLKHPGQNINHNEPFQREMLRLAADGAFRGLW